MVGVVVDVRLPLLLPVLLRAGPRLHRALACSLVILVMFWWNNEWIVCFSGYTYDRWFLNISILRSLLCCLSTFVTFSTFLLNTRRFHYPGRQMWLENRHKQKLQMSLLWKPWQSLIFQNGQLCFSPCVTFSLALDISSGDFEVGDKFWGLVQIWLWWW